MKPTRPQGAIVALALVLLAMGGVGACQSAETDRAAAPDAIAQPLDDYRAALAETVVAHHAYRSAVVESVSTRYDPILALLHPSDPPLEQVQAEIVPARDRHAVAVTAEAEALAGLTEALAADTETDPVRITAATTVAELAAQKAAVDVQERDLAIAMVDVLSTKASVCTEVPGLGQVCADKLDVTRFNAVAERENQMADASKALLEQLRSALAGVPVDLLTTLDAPPLVGLILVSDDPSTLPAILRSMHGELLQAYSVEEISAALEIIEQTGGSAGVGAIAPLPPQ